MEIEFRTINRDDEKEMKFVAERDSKIPLLYDPEYDWNTNSISSREDFYTKQISREDFFDVAVVSSRIVGFHIIKKIPYPPGLFAGSTVTLWVDSELRGRGIGTSLKQRGEKWARNLNLAYLITMVHPTNKEMLHINKKSGFDVVQYTMRKKL